MKVHVEGGTMKTVIIYQSRYGVSKQYAIWISEQIKADIFDISNIDKEKLTEYESIIFVSGVMYQQISILANIKKYRELLNDKKITFMLCVVNNELMYQKTLESFFTNQFKLFTLPGYLSMEHLNSWDKMQIAVTKHLNPKSEFLESIKYMKDPRRSFLDEVIPQL